MAQRVRDTDPAARVERDARRHVAAGLAGRGAWVDLRAEDGPAAFDPPPEGATPLTCAFADDGDLAAVREAAGHGGLVTVFDTLEHLSDAGGLVALLVELAGRRAATVVVGVGDERAFDSLRTQLPADHAIWHQLALRGTAVVPAGHEGLHEGAVALTGDATPLAFLAAFGPHAGELASAVSIVQAEAP
jgi:hypothetical protein